jgi:hypothetical protein
MLFVVNFCYQITVDEDRSTPGADRSAQPSSLSLREVQKH